MNENNFKEEKFSCLGNVVTNTGDEKEDVKIELKK